jgi:hypothetical protein
VDIISTVHISACAVRDYGGQRVLCRQREGTKKKLKGNDKWFETTEDELRAYFALIILMSQVQKPSIH